MSITNKLNLPKVELKLIELTDERIKTLRPTTSLDIKETNSGSFAENGLFSTTTFGRLGTPERDTRFSYIPIHTKVFHPWYYKQLVKLKGLYKGILTGSEYAIFDTELKDFVSSDVIHGQTGYSFFMKHFNQLAFTRNGSKKRDMRIDFLEKYRNKCLYDKILVLPAGLRDMQEDKNGKVTEGEINEFYRRIIGASNTIASMANTDTPLLDTSRVSIQNGFNNVVELLSGMIKGKGGFIQGKWGKRGLATTTRSVITSISPGTAVLGSGESIGYNQTAVGIFQAAKSYKPLVVNAILSYTSTLFQNGKAYLIDKNTLNRVMTDVDDVTIDSWTTSSGIEKMLNNFYISSVRTSPIIVSDDYYLCLIWTGVIKGKKCYRIVNDINELPEGFDRKDVRPITYTEFIYLIRLLDWDKDIYFITRYPVTGDGSTYPSTCFIRTTVNSEVRYRLDVNWQIEESVVAKAFPILENATFTDSLSVHPARLGELGGDHDGDKVSSLSLFTDDARQEVYDYLNSPKAYVVGGNRMVSSPYTEVVNRVLFNITGD